MLDMNAMKVLAAACVVMASVTMQAKAIGAVDTRSLPIVIGKDSAGQDIVGECELAWDAAIKTPQPGVLVFPEWWGCNTYTKARARQLAELGYVALAVDVYGGGKTTTDAGQAGKWAGELKGNREALRGRAKAVLDTLVKLREVNAKKVAAIGYCFGGTTALELARSGADLSAVVSFHGDLTALPAGPGKPEPAITGPALSGPTTAQARQAPATQPTSGATGVNATGASAVGLSAGGSSAVGTSAVGAAIKARILVCHGAADPLVPPKAVQSFLDEMASGGVDYVLITYAKAAHGFTNPAAGAPATGKAVAYNADADRRSWQAMRDFFDEVLK